MSENFVSTPEWSRAIKGSLRAEMVRRGITYAHLSSLLEKRFDTQQTESNLKAKINKGVMGAQLFVQILSVLGCHVLDIEQIVQLAEQQQELD